MNEPAERPDIDAAEWERRLAFLGLGEDDRRRLRALAPVFAQHFGDFVDGFYRHLFGFDATAQLLADPEQVARLKNLQKSHFESLLEADWGEAYVDRRRRVGQAHAEVGLEPHLYVGAYNQYLQYCLRCYAQLHGLDPDKDLAWLPSLVKAVLLDISLSLDAYFKQMTGNLREALDMLWKANQDLRQFAQMTTHDLKTPLATMANLCDEAVDEFGEDMPGEARELIESARSAAFRMSAMIDELLTSAVDGSEDEPKEFNSGEVFREAVDRVRPMMKDRGILLEMPDQWPAICGNKVRLREAIYNIVANAAKFIDKEDGRIVVTAKPCGRRCSFCIADNGPGIPQSEHKRIFVPFRRLPMHRNRPGSGLGLYFAKNLIEEEGGRVWVESEPGEEAGSTSNCPAPGDAVLSKPRRDDG